MIGLGSDKKMGLENNMIMAPPSSAIQATLIIGLLTFSQVHPQPQPATTTTTTTKTTTTTCNHNHNRNSHNTQTWTCVFWRGGGASFSLSQSPFFTFILLQVMSDVSAITSAFSKNAHKVNLWKTFLQTRQ